MLPRTLLILALSFPAMLSAAESTGQGMAERLAGEQTIYDYTQSDAYPIERIVDLADKASTRDASTLSEIIAALGDKHPVIRYWAAMGCLIRQKKAAPAKAKLKALLKDDFAEPDRRTRKTLLSLRLATASGNRPNHAATDRSAAVQDDVQAGCYSTLGHLDPENACLTDSFRLDRERIHAIGQSRQFPGDGLDGNAEGSCPQAPQYHRRCKYCERLSWNEQRR